MHKSGDSWKKDLSGHPCAGFTFIEMMVSVLIVAIMIAVISPKLANAGHQAEVTANAQNEQIISAALSEYQLMYHSVPTGTSEEQLQTLVTDNLISSIPVDPLGGQYVIDDSDPFNISVTTTDATS
jgi:prepilin-type N-terminal cleavage/methylation domain-containing protein